MYINKFQIAVFIGILLLVPSLICFYTFDVFEFPKVFLLIISLTLVSLLTLFKKVHIGFNFFDIFFGLFVFINILSTLFSIDPMYGFFGYFGNPAGSVFLLFSIFIFLLTHKGFIYSIKKNTLLKLVLYSGIFPCFYGLLQVLNIDPFGWQNQLTDHRIFSTLGQPNFFAIYLGLLFFCAVILYFEYKSKFVLAYLGIICLLVINTKSLSEFIAIFLCSVLYIVFNFKKSKKLFILVFLLIIPFYFFILYPRITSQINGSQTLIKTDDTANIRLILWKNTLLQTLNFKTLLLGNGPENFAFSFKRPSELNTTSEWSLVFFKPHNLLIDSLYTVGIVGLIFYLYILVISFLKLKYDSLYIIPIFLLLSSFFLWLPSYLYFILLLVFYYLYGKGNAPVFLKSTHAYSFILLPTLYIFLISILYFVSNIFYFFAPCFSYNLFVNYQPYIIECGLKTNSDLLVKKGYLANPLNKIYIEKSGIYFLNNHNKYGKTIFENAYSRDSTDPIFMYYYGLSNEVFGNKGRALELYKNAKSNSYNFYLNEAAIKRLDNR